MFCFSLSLSRLVRCIVLGWAGGRRSRAGDRLTFHLWAIGASRDLFLLLFLLDVLLLLLLGVFIFRSLAFSGWLTALV